MRSGGSKLFGSREVRPIAETHRMPPPTPAKRALWKREYKLHLERQKHMGITEELEWIPLMSGTGRRKENG